MKRLLCCALLCFLPALAARLPPSQLTEQPSPYLPPAREDPLATEVDTLFAEWNKPSAPGCALAIVRDGKVVYETAYGMASIKPAVPITTQMVFPAGSVSKQFTAALIGILASRGQLSLDDDIRKYLKELPDYGVPITIRHLVHHTSGLKDYASLKRLIGPRELPTSDEDLLRFMARQKGLNYSPGAEHMYTNTGYAMLGLIINRVTGKSMHQFAEEALFKPLGMKHTYFHQPNEGESLVVGYTQASNGDFIKADIVPSKFDQTGDGGLRTTVGDMVLWDQNYYTPTTWDDKLNQLLMTSGRLKDGPLPPSEDYFEGYAFGLELGTYKGIKWVGHAGASNGFHSIIYRMPSERFAVIILANTDTMWMWPLARQISDIYLKDRFQAMLAEYAGAYDSSELEARYDLVVQGGELIVRRAKASDERLRSIRTDRFRGSSFGDIQFTRDRSGKVNGLVLSADAVGFREVRFERK